MYNIVIPLTKSVWEKEILFTLRSIDKFFDYDYNIYICGDWKPNWLANVTYIPFVYPTAKESPLALAGG